MPITSITSLPTSALLHDMRRREETWKILRSVTPANICAVTRRLRMPPTSSILIWRDSNCLRRQPYARMRTPRITALSYLLRADVGNGPGHPAIASNAKSPAQSTGQPHERGWPVPVTTIAQTDRANSGRSLERAIICVVRKWALNASRVVTPHLERRKLLPATALRVRAHTAYSERYRCSYGRGYTSTGAPCTYVLHQVPGPCNNLPPGPTSPLLPVSFIPKGDCASPSTRCSFPNVRCTHPERTFPRSIIPFPGCITRQVYAPLHYSSRRKASNSFTTGAACRAQPPKTIAAKENNRHPIRSTQAYTALAGHHVPPRQYSSEPKISRPTFLDSSSQNKRTRLSSHSALALGQFIARLPNSTSIFPIQLLPLQAANELTAPEYLVKSDHTAIHTKGRESASLRPSAGRAPSNWYLCPKDEAYQ